MTNFVVINKESLDKISINAQHIKLNEVSIIQTKLHREDVAEFIRDGNNLILKLINGEVIIIENFFVVQNDIASDLVFEADNGCDLYWFDGVSGFKDISGLEALLPAASSVSVGGSLLPWIIGGGAVVGGLAAAISSGGDGNKNTSPVAVRDNVIGDEDKSIIGNVLNNDRDSNGDVLEVVKFTVNGQTYNAGQTVVIDDVGQLTLNADGSYNFEPLPNWNGTVPTVIYTITDNKGGIDSTELNITVNPVVDLVAADDSISTDEDTPVQGSVAGNDSTTSGGTLTYVKASDPSHGSVVVNSDGSYTYTPNANFNGSDSFTYTVTDAASGESLTQTVNVTVNPVNDPPVGVSDTFDALEGTTTTFASVLTNDTDIDSPASSLAAIQVATDQNGSNATSVNGIRTITTVLGGTVTMNADGTFEYTAPVRDHSDTIADIDSFYYKVSDGSDSSEWTKVTLNITDDVPTANNDTDTVAAGQFTAETGNVLTGVGTTTGTSGADVVGADGASITQVESNNVSTNTSTDNGTTLTITGQYGTLILDKTTGEYSYQRATGTPGGVSDIFSYTLTDGDGDQSTATLTLVIGDSTPSLSIPAAGGSTTTVYESGLSTGSEAGTNKETTSGTISFTSPDGLATTNAVMLGGHVLTTTSQTFSDGLTASYSYNSTTGEGTITYSYTLPTNTSGDNTTATFAVVVTDIDGDTSASGNLVIKIVDDVPTISVFADDSSIASLTVKDHDTITGTSIATQDFSSAFTESHVTGADGSTTGVTWTYALSIDNAASGLTSGGVSIVLSMNNGEIVGTANGDTIFTLDVSTSGEVTLTQYQQIDHSDNTDPSETLLLSNGKISLTATASITDGDGDTAKATQTIDLGDKIVFTDDGPTIGTPVNQEVDEANLANGSDPDASALTQSGSLAVSLNGDDTGASAGITLATDQTALTSLDLSSGGVLLSYYMNADGSVLTAYKGTDQTVANEVFTLVINSDGTYSFTLIKSLDHGSATSLDLPFSFTATDGDGDTASNSFTVTVLDDSSAPATRALTVIEDSTSSTSANTFNTTADANVSITTNPSYGTVPIDSATGKITYVPNANYSGADSFTYTTTNDDGSTQNTTVSVTVTPVADQPDWDGDAVGVGGNITLATVTTKEDTAVKLGFNAPRVTDATDQNGTTSGDSPERIGVITLSGLPAGAKLLYNNAVVATSTGSNIQIWLTDVNHPTDQTMSTDAVQMTSAEFEALQVLPAAESSSNFTVQLSVTSYEVDDSGAQISTVAGATSTATVKVVVTAVTDSIDLTISDGTNYVDASTLATAVKATIAEDTVLNLSNLLKVTLGTTNDGNTTADIDGSEKRWFTVTGLPEGTTITVDGTSHTITAAESYTIDISSYDGTSTSLPSITITPPKDFSGDISGIKITLYAQDIDSDGIASENGVQISDSVYLNVHVTPVAGDITASSGVSTLEDTAVTFLNTIALTDTDGSETITGITINNIPTGWVITDANDNVVVTGTGSNSYTIPAADITSGAYSSYKVTPPANSSADTTLSISVSTQDTISGSMASEDTATATTNLSVKVTVTPAAEVVGGDLTMTAGHGYTTAGYEDTWYTLGTENSFNLADGWVNQDTDESTYALLTPVLVTGDSAATVMGVQFKWTDNGVEYTATYTGTAIQVPVTALSTLQFLAPENVSGTFNIQVQAYTVDYDDDSEGVGTPATATSGNALLSNIVINPVADGISTLSLNGRAIGLEDTEIPLSIVPRSSDPSETFNVTITDIPDGATITYGGVVQTIVNGTLTITNFSTTTSLTITPPANSNENFTLSVTATTTDGTETSAASSVLSIPVTVHGVADTAVVTLKDYDTSQTGIQTYSTTEAYLDDTSSTGGQHKVALSNLIDSVASVDTDGSEVFTIRITGLDEDFSISGAATVLVTGTGTERVWVIKSTDLDKVFITLPENYSGTVDFQVAGVSTENDGDSNTAALIDVSFSVTPSAEATATTSATLVEDEITSLNFGIVYQNGDNDETLGTVWIPVSEATGSDYTLYLGTGSSAVVLSAANLSIETINGVDYYQLTAAQAETLAAKGADQLDGALGSFSYLYEVIDDHYGSTETLPADTIVKSGSFTLSATAVTDAVNLSITSMAGLLSSTSTSDQHANDDATPDTAVLSSPDTVTVTLNISSADYDGSEHVIRVLIENVPDGVTIQGDNAQQLGAGTWVIVYDGSDALSINDAGGIDLPITFNVSQNAGDLVNKAIKITVQSQDNGENLTTTTDIVSDSVTWYLNTTFNAAEADKAPTIDQWEYNNTGATEDTAFALSDVVDQAITIQANQTTNLFTVTLSDLPEGTTVSGMYETWIDTNGDGINETPVWTASVTVAANTSDEDAEAALQKLLESILITPPSNWNDNGESGEFHFDATLTTSVLGGQSQEQTIDDMTIPIAPVTDDPVFTMITDGTVLEGATSIAGSITIDSADGTFGTVVDGKLYVMLDTTNTTDAMEGGTLSVDGNTLSLQTVSGVTGVPDGDYYVIDVTEAGSTVNWVYTLPDGAKTVVGDVTFVAYAQVQETGAQAKTVTTSNVVDVQITNNGVVITSSDVEGSESAQATKSNAIELTGSGGLTVTLNDADGSESYGAILLSNVPVGFLVYVGDDASSATLASNAGGDGTSNTWVLSESGGLPAYVAILPPTYWSGTVSGLELTVTSGENSLSPVTLTETQALGDLIVNAVANGVDLTPTSTFGNENSIIPLNLNASMHDPAAANASQVDSSTETTTIQLTGLGEYASFYINGVQISQNQITITGSGTNTVYTITGLTQDELEDLGFKQAKASLTDQDTTTSGLQIGVEAWTVETTGDESAHTTSTITLSVTTQQATSGNDTLLYTASTIDAGAGTDTIELRSHESVSGTELASTLKNIEVIDLSVDGANSITNLLASDVLSMTSNATLTINGTLEDSVQLGTGWTQGATADGYVTYTGLASGKTVTLLVSANIGSEDNTITGTSGDDTIIASSGDDTMTTGNGHDTLIYNVLDAADAKAGYGITTWTDFSLGDTDSTSSSYNSNADTIQFSSDFFTGLLSDNSNIDSYIKVETVNGTTTLSVDRDGAANGTSYQDLLVIENQTTNVTLDDLLNNNQIVIG